MKNNKVAFFLPTRKGSQRVINKNTRPFANMKGGLLENKLRQLINSERIDEIILSTNDEECISVAMPYTERCSRIKIVRRPDELCMDSTNLQDLILYVPTITDAQHILWGHVTTPFVDGAEYDNAIETYFSKLKENYDSLISVLGVKNFFLNKKGVIINNTTSIPWPRTQDLDTLYEINHAVFLAKREIYEKQKNRVGETPYLYEMDKLKSFDIDWEEDFAIAEMLYKMTLRNNK
jgi:N-acylneuraminate cytidylyltransferase